MQSYSIRNEFLTISVNSFGAELRSLILNETGKEYLWQADPAYWKRTSPVLFPIVGRLKNNTYKYNGKSYPMQQHGFARDMEFTSVEKTENSLLFVLTDNSQTLTIYPFHFTLLIGYQLSGKSVIVTWKVKNTNQNTMYFSIGSHPAFCCPLDEEEKQSDCFFSFDTEGPLTYSRIENGLYKKEKYIKNLTEHAFPIDEHLFDKDVLIFENSQAKTVSLLTSKKKPYLSVHFNAPLFGLWSPPKKHAPFVCIEPWYGRCDAESFDGTLEERVYGNRLLGGEEFSASYTIEIL